MTAELTPPLHATERWMQAASSFMPPLQGPAGTAERLLLLLHYSIEWDTAWVANYRTTYWDKILPERVLVTSHQVTNLRAWWTQIADELEAFPATHEARAELAYHLDHPNPQDVLRVFTTETLALVMRTRIVAETRSQQRKKHF